jgi:kynurenine 3-monooxygenase
VPVFGRTLHSATSEQTYQPYGPDRSYCNFSVSRWELNTVLMTAAEEAGCRIVFNHPLAHVDVPHGLLFFYLQDAPTTQLYQKTVKCAHIFATDGGGSRCRQALKGMLRVQAQDRAEPLRYGYKELSMPKPPASADMALDTLHIWPRGTHFMMALPNCDGSNTMTLYMPEAGGPVSFAAINTPAKVRAYFEETYPDAVPLMPHYEEEFLRNPTGFLGTVFCSPWSFQDRLLLLGDSAHAITPFFGQGCNMGFEDVSVLDAVLKEFTTKGGKRDMEKVFSEVYQRRKPDADAMGNMAIDNFTEMMSKTASEKFLLEKAIEIELTKRFPQLYASRYVLVTHSLVPYHKCMQIGALQQKIVSLLAKDITKVEQVDYALAKRLIDAELTPYLKKNHIQAKDFNFTCKYYSKAKL